MDKTQEEGKKDAPVKVQGEEIDFEERYKKYEDVMKQEAMIRSKSLNKLEEDILKDFKDLES